MDWVDEVKLVLQKIEEDEAFRQAFFADPSTALMDIALSPIAYRYLLSRVTEATYKDEFNRFFAREALIVRGEDNQQPQPPTTTEDEKSAPERIVSTGFSDFIHPGVPTNSHLPLNINSDYYYWFEVGEPVTGSIEVEETTLPVEQLPPEALLQVVLFGFDGELILQPGADVGEIKIGQDGRIRVAKPVSQPAAILGDELLQRRLFFPIRTPSKGGVYRLRCNVYFQQSLVQSRLVTVEVASTPVIQAEPALKAEVDYTLSKSLDGRQLHGMGQNRLSLMLNDNGNGTHGFRFFGQNEFKNDAALGEGELQDLITKARGALRKAAWGDEGAYSPDKPYLYSGPPDEAQLSTDLIRLAIRGYRFYDAIINQLAGDSDRAWELADLMLKPGQLQIANKQSARMVVPAALFYDFPLDDGRPTGDFSLCSTFLGSFRMGLPLADTACFLGECPNYADDTIVCPSGFWGYRHSLGLPVSTNEAPDAPPEIPSPATPSLDISLFAAFQALPNHLERLQAMEILGQSAQSRDATLAMLKDSTAQLIYFYCHGGITNENIPFLQVGTDADPRLTRANIRNKRIRWQKPRPLVFINGCHTTALSPEAAIDLVSGFVENAGAAGVIGTEISIFEPLAVSFAEACFDRFLIQRQTIGEAVRGTRLAMLQMGNPLGLVYIPFVMAGLKLAASD